MDFDSERLRGAQRRVASGARQAASVVRGFGRSGEPSDESDCSGDSVPIGAPERSRDHFFDPNPTVAIIVPARNEERFLRPCLRSIREQYFNSWECIVVDDGSSDGTRAIADDFARRDSRFRVVSHTESLGLAAARNTGIELTTAPYLTFLDADDFLYQHSLNARVEALREGDAETVAGSYCDWQPTRENEGRTAPERPPAIKKQAISFFDGPECPFIATAPMVRRSVIEAHGGFNEDLPTAEDYDLWVRILRSGLTFVYTPRIGVAYRQKASGMVFTDTAMHAQASDAIIARQYEDLTDAPDRPHLYRPLSSYHRDLVRARRLLRSFALAEASADKTDQEVIGSMLPDDLGELSRLGLDVRFELVAGLARAARAVPSFNQKETRQRLVDDLERRVFSDHAATSPPVPSPAGSFGSLRSSDRSSRRSTAPVISTPRPIEPTQKQSLGVLLVPMARYHAVEMLSLGNVLAEAGVDTTFLVIDEFGSQFSDLLVAADRFPLDCEPSDLPTFSGVYMMNDWGVTRELIREARVRGVPTFARVEGVQDYRDVDTGRIRLPYQTADYVLAQGQNDVGALNHRHVAMVGNGRLEELLHDPERTADSATGRVVINSNFTYGVFTSLRNVFVESSVRACLEAELTPIISQHPADAELPASLGRWRSSESMSNLLHESDVLISRFSTVPFEAMAIGTPFVYFRPQDERVATFDEPNGAYEIVHSSLELVPALIRAASQLGSYRRVSEEFFRKQIDITTETADQRTAAVIAASVSEWEASAT